MPAHAGIQIRFGEAPKDRLDSGIRRNNGGEESRRRGDAFKILRLTADACLI
jgi:hypothetical protein